MFLQMPIPLLIFSMAVGVSLSDSQINWGQIYS